MRPVDARLSKLYLALGHNFGHPELLDEALTHPSVTQVEDGRRLNYERLEFLGDRVLGLVVAELLVERFPSEPEGHLSRRHVELVRREALARVAAGIGLGTHVQMSRGEEEAGGRESPATLADCLEAVIAALYIDGGIVAAKRFIRTHWIPLMNENVRPPKDAKTELQEWAQARSLPLPAYNTVGTEGPDHSPRFSVEVIVEGMPRASAVGRSKRSAEQAAAQALLTYIRSRGKG